MNFLYVLIAGAAVFFAFQIRWWVGIALLVIMLGLGIYYFIPSFYIAKGNQLYQSGDEEGALVWYKKAYDTGRMKIQTKASYAYLLLRTGNADEAEKILDPIIRVKNLDPAKKNIAKQQRCMVYYRQGRLDEAIEEAQELYDNGYATSNLYGMLGYFKLLRGDDPEETLKVCEEAFDYDRDNRDIMDNLSICYYRLGRYAEAEEISDELLDSSDSFIEGCYHGAQIAAALGKYDKALQLAEKISECKRTPMTTISEEQIESLRREIEQHL